MIQAYYTGINGMQTSSYGINVVSDNISNVNTTGFRGSNYEFASLFEKTLDTTKGSVTSDSIGMGARLQATPMIQSSGSYTATDKNTDLAIMGSGWFGLEGNGDVSYTRDGAFGFDSDSYLVSNEGKYVLGSMGDNISNKNVLTKPLTSVPLKGVNEQTKLHFPNTLLYPATPTTKAKFSGNLGPVKDGKVRSMSASVIDAKGTTNKLQLLFKAATPQPAIGSKWDLTASIKAVNGKKIYDTKKGVVSFDERGALVSNTLKSIDNNGSPISIDLGSDFNGIVSLDNSEIAASSTVNGSIAGNLTGYDINKNGEVIASFTNGKQSSVGQIAVYHFQNDQGLHRLSGTQFSASANSGKAIFYQNKEHKNIIGTTLRTNRLEGSNVNITDGLTNLIVLQRSYDANSKSITTADEMIQKALKMGS